MTPVICILHYMLSSCVWEGGTCYLVVTIIIDNMVLLRITNTRCIKFKRCMKFIRWHLIQIIELLEQ